MLRASAFVFIALLAGFANGRPATRSSRDSDVEKLIDRLVGFGGGTTGTHATAWTSQFMAIDEEPEFHGGVFGSPKPVVDPTLRRLVQLGIRALPGLLAHLSDKRETKFTIAQGFGMWFASEYDSRYADPKRRPSGVPG